MTTRLLPDILKDWLSMTKIIREEDAAVYLSKRSSTASRPSAPPGPRNWAAPARRSAKAAMRPPSRAFACDTTQSSASCSVKHGGLTRPQHAEHDKVPVASNRAHAGIFYLSTLCTSFNMCQELFVDEEQAVLILR